MKVSFRTVISLILLYCFNFSKAQDSTKYIKQIIRKDSTNHWKYFVFIGGGKGYCRNADGTAFAGDACLAYKSHLFSFCGGGSYTSHKNNSSNTSSFNYGYLGLLFGEHVKYKSLFASLSIGLTYTNLQYVVRDLRIYAVLDGYIKSGLTIPVELKIAALSIGNFGVGINVSKNFTFNSKYAPWLVTASFVFGQWSPKNKAKRFSL